MPTYKAPIEDVKFLLNDVFHMERYGNMPGFADASPDLVAAILEEAAKFAPVDQLAVSPQCGFASTEEGNILSEEEQWAKLRLAVEVANEVWGK